MNLKKLIKNLETYNDIVVKAIDNNREVLIYNGLVEEWENITEELKCRKIIDFLIDSTGLITIVIEGSL